MHCLVRRLCYVSDGSSVRGPTGRFNYTPHEFDSIGMLAGGTGITPMLQIMKSLAMDAKDLTNIRLIFSNSTDKDIILGAGACLFR